MRTFLVGTLLFILALGSKAQPVNLGDSLRHYMEQENKLLLRLDTRNSFITGRSAQIRGVKAGVSFGDRLSFGIGYNWLKKGFYQDYVLDPRTALDTVSSRLHFHFLSPFAEYVFYDRKGFSVAIPVQIGFGTSWLSYDDLAGNKSKTDKKFVMLYEPAMTVEQRFLKYFAAGFGVGYRLMLKNNKEVDARFSSPIYLVRLRLIFSELYKDFYREE